MQKKYSFLFPSKEYWMPSAINDIRLKFRRSYLGPFWIAISSAITIAALGYVFINFFDQQPTTYLPYLACGVVIWNYITTTISECSIILIENRPAIQNIKTPISAYFFRVNLRNLITVLVNMTVVILVLLIFSDLTQVKLFHTIIALGILIGNLFWIGTLSAIISVRFRDVPHMITSGLQVCFFITPVFWIPTNVFERPAFLTYNPFYHLLEVIRQPLLGNFASSETLIYTLIMLILGNILTVYIFSKTVNKIPYWV